MREPYGEAVAPQAGPELWRGGREVVLQALAGERVGWVWSHEMVRCPGCRGHSLVPKASPAESLVRDSAGPRVVRDPMHARRLSALELGGPEIGPAGDGGWARAVNPKGARRR